MKRLSVYSLVSGFGLLAAPSLAVPPQAAATSETASVASAEAGAPDAGDIVVTARKRDETLVSVPLSVVAIGAQQLDRYQIASFQDLSTISPDLKVGIATGTGGGTIYLRGIGNSGFQATLDQAVSINVDGVQFSRAQIFKVGQFDMAQIELLKGPQALFFGKNSPGGVISIRTASPTKEFEGSIKAGYEFDARQRFVEGVVSSPLTDNFGVRLAIYGNKMDGYLKNDGYGGGGDAANAIRPGTVFGPKNARSPNREDIYGRATLKYEPSDAFSALAKFTYGELSSDGPNRFRQKIYCPAGAASTTTIASLLGNAPGLAAALAIDDCKPNDHFTHGDYNPATLTASGLSLDDAAGYLRSKIGVGSLELNYTPSDTLKLTSVSGYSNIKEAVLDISVWGLPDLPSIDFKSDVNNRLLSQELRLATDFTDSPINGVVGAYYADEVLTVGVRNVGAGPAALFYYRIPTKSASAFAQLSWKILPTLELSGGARYTDEKKSQDVRRDGVPQPVIVQSQRVHDVSPEVTLSWRPDAAFNTYLSYREGFKSGGFAALLSNGPPIAPPGLRNDFAPEHIKGFEGGIKAEVLERSLLLTAAAYDYDYRNLQVSSLDNSSLSGAIIRVTNAAKAKVKGIELAADWRSRSVPGLALRGALNYNGSKYTNYLAPCYTGQTIAEGCAFQLIGGQYRLQDLSGHKLTNSSRWTGLASASYTSSLTSRLDFGLSVDANYASAFNPLPEELPDITQKRYWMLNASVRIFTSEKGWELALIGRNLTNVYRAMEATGNSLTGIASRTGTNIPGGKQDIGGTVTQGRQTLVRATYRF